jgi:RNase P subunit RPR2
MDPTTKFQHALPYTVLLVSPPLAALYTTRAQSSTHSDSCSKCGSYLLDGNAIIRLVHLKTLKTRALRRTCRACGSTNELPLDAERPAPNPLARGDHPSHTPPIPQELKPTPESLPPAQKKSRSKRKTGLQDILSRSREKQKEEQRRNDGQVGLAAFLSNL